MSALVRPCRLRSAEAELSVTQAWTSAERRGGGSSGMRRGSSLPVRLFGHRYTMGNRHTAKKIASDHD
jgi:hypothetical protein